MTSGSDLLFQSPWTGYLIFLLVPFFIGQYALNRYRKKQLSLYTSSHLLNQLLIARSPLLRDTKNGLWAIAWLLVCLALMGPYGNIRYSSLSSPSSSTTDAGTKRVNHQVVFLVDTSASMRVPDGAEGQSRLDTAKMVMQDIVQGLQGQTVSLYAFTSELTPVVPPTLDYLFTRLAIKNLHIDEGGVGGTSFGPVLTELKKEAFPHPKDQITTVILFSDGGDTKLETLQGAAKDQEIKEILNALPDPKQNHLHLLTVGIGSLKAEPIPNVTFNGKPVLSKLEPEILKELASQERGEYLMANSGNSWDLAQNILSEINNNRLSDSLEMQSERKVEAIKQQDFIYDLYYQIPLAVALFFYLLNLLLPDVYRL